MTYPHPPDDDRTWDPNDPTGEPLKLKRNYEEEETNGCRRDSD